MTNFEFICTKCGKELSYLEVEDGDGWCFACIKLEDQY
jgi:hypothetical protein